MRVATRRSNIGDQQDKPGPWWLSLRTGPPMLMDFTPGVAER